CWCASAPSTSSLKYSTADSRRNTASLGIDESPTRHLRLGSARRVPMSFCLILHGLYNNTVAVVCPLCGQRKARRACPALGKQICPVCCGTKRLVQIECPGDCAYLTSAREHPPAAAVRRQQRDLGLVMQFLRDLSDRQSQLFSPIPSFLVRYQAPEPQPLIDDDVAEAAAALAATFETSARGVIYEHRPASLPAERLMSALKPVLNDLGKQGGTPFER